MPLRKNRKKSEAAKLVHRKRKSAVQNEEVNGKKRPSSDIRADENKIENDVVCVSTGPENTDQFSFKPLSKFECTNICAKLFIENTYENVKQSENGGLLGKPCQIKSIKGDGNCYFRALSYVLSGTEENHISLRSAIVNHLLENSSTFSAFLNPEHSTSLHYVQTTKMNELNTWATDMEIMSSCHLLKTDIYIYSHSRWLKYSQQLINPDYLISDKAIYLNHPNQNHFEVVICVKEKNGKCQYCNKTSDAKKAYDKRKYQTDKSYRERLKAASISKYQNDKHHRKKVTQYSVNKYKDNLEHRKTVQTLSCRKYKEDKIHQENVKKYSAQKYKENPLHRNKQKHETAHKYKQNVLYRNKKIRQGVEKYRLNVLHREHVKRLSVRKYKENIHQRERVIKQSSERYKTDPIHKAKVMKQNTIRYHSSDSFKRKVKDRVSTYRTKKKEKMMYVDNLRRVFRKLILERPDYICAVCFKKCFSNQVTPCSLEKYSCRKKFVRDLAQNCVSDKYLHKCSNKCASPCSHENSSSARLWICHTCNRKILDGRMPEEAHINNLHLQEIPEELQCLNTLEKHLISLNIAFGKLMPLPRSGQLSIRGPMVCVPSNIQKTTNILPRSESDDELIKVKLKRKLSFKGYVSYKLVSTAKIQKALDYLVKHNPFYKDVIFNNSWASTLSVDSKTEETLAVDMADESETPDDQNINDETHNVDDHGLIMNSCLQPVDIGQDILDQCFDNVFCVAPAEGNDPVSLLIDQTNEAKSFPALFPVGSPTYHDKRNKRITIARYLLSRILLADSRFAKCQDYIFYAQYASEVYQVLSSVSIALRKSYASATDKKTHLKRITDTNSLKEIFRSDSGYKFLKPIRGTPAFWQVSQKELFAMLRQLGIPTWFCSFSCGDTRWPEIINAVLEEDGDDRKAEQLDWNEKCELLRKYPVTVSRLFDRRFHNFLRHVVLSSVHPIGKITDYFFRVEFQQRGSPHTHCLFWVEDAPQIDRNSDEEVSDFFDKYVSCEMPSVDEDAELHDVVSTVQQHSRRHSNSCRKKGTTCRFHFPRQPSENTFICRPVEDSQNTSNVTGNINEINPSKPVLTKEQAQHVLGKLWKAISEEQTECRTLLEIFAEIQITQDLLQQAMDTLTKKHSVVMKRKPSDVWINGYNPELLRLWNANMDIQYVTDAYSCVVYIISYISKAEREMGLLLEHAHKEAQKGNDDAKSAMKKLGGVYLHNREVSVQEAVYRVCGLKLKECSRKVQFVPVGGNPVKLSKPLRQLRSLGNPENINEEDLWMPSLVDKYKSRPDSNEFENICLASFASDFRVISKSEARKIKPENRRTPVHTLQNGLGYIQKRSRTKPAVIRYAKFSPSKEPEKHYQSKLQLFLPYRYDKQFKPSTFTTYEDFFRSGSVQIGNSGIKTVQDIVESNRLKFEKAKEELDRAEEILDQSGELEDAWAQLCPETESDRLACESEKVVTHSNEQGSNDIPDLFNKQDTRSGTIELRKPKIPTNVAKNLLRSMNKQQQEIFYQIRQWCFSKRHGNKVDPFHLFITGGAGTGKSHLIKCICYEASRILSPMLDNPDDFTVILTAPTGVAAFNIDAATIHHTFVIGVDSKLPYQPLGDEKITALRSKLHSLQIVIIDEISMVDHKILSYIHGRLRQIKQRKDFLPFGGVSIIAVGDFFQLSPVKGKSLYSENTVIDLWTDNFQLAQLTQIMRQKDGHFAHILNRLRTRKKSTPLDLDDVQFLQSRETGEELESLHIFATNAQVDEFNVVRLNSRCSDPLILNAEDFCKNPKTGRLEKRDKQYIRTNFSNLPRQIILAVGARVMLTRNIDVSDGLVNGVFGTVSLIEKKMTDTLPSIIYVHFDKNNVGEKLRSKCSLPDNLTNSTPIKVAEERVNNSGGIRRQFPLKLSYACTVHKIQGVTLSEAVVSLHKIFAPGQAYVALSRVTSPEGLVIQDFKETAIYCNEHVEPALNKMPLFVTRHYSTTKHSQTTLILHNVQSLVSNIEEIRTDKRFGEADYICLTETWLQSDSPGQNTELTGYRLSHRCRASSYNNSKPMFANFRTQSRGGVGVYHKEHMEFQMLTLATDNLEHIGFLCPDSNMTVLVVYRPPSYTMGAFTEKLSCVLRELSKLSGRSLVIGDFNENFLQSKTISTIMAQHGFEQCVKEATTEGGTLLDHVYARGINPSVDVVPTYFSYHDAVLIAF